MKKTSSTHSPFPSASAKGKPAKRTTLRQVAAAAEVSLSTASHILGTRADRYSPEMRERVRRTAVELGYRPNGFAKAMRSGRFGAASLLLSSNPDHSELFNPLTIGIHDALAEQGMHLTLDMLSDKELTDPKFVPRFLRVRMVDGLLIAYYHGIPERFKALLHQNQIPSVWVNSRHAADCVHPDDLAAGRQAAGHLLKRGCRRIAYADYTLPVPSDGMTARGAGCAQALREAGFAPRKISPADKLPRTERIAFSRAWLEKRDRPDAVVCISLTTALPILQTAAEMGIRVPEDLALVTFATQPVNHTGVHVTSLQIPFNQVGRQAVAMLGRKLAQPGEPQPPELVPFTLDPGATS
ncbi:MAG: LacI family DNA-binding transcriptional regulator [Kiritimatiellia bacterium]|jgi:LacI family transcriptional regulator